MCNNLAITRINENGDVLLFKKSSNFHRMRVGVASQHVHCVVNRLGLFLRGFIFGFETFFRWFTVLIFYWFNHEELALFAVIFSAPRGTTPDDSKAAKALAMMRSCFNVDSTVTAHWLVDVREYYYMFNLEMMKPGGSAGSGSTTPSTASASPAVEVAASMAEKHPDTSEDANLRKHSKRVASEQLASVSRSTTKAPTEKGKSQLGREMSRRRKSQSRGTPIGICVKWRIVRG
ncbi:hypothetical protein B296_00022060 [Ensete ventricosum]|uniref:Uncharacterized protein n=1 Tax=Ensete ventricosum TaxID=4639 RepID=A0A426XVU0_ENSVE|nr:hypothetical protein B296_00022060 [Ensete ventricosum]